LNNGIVSLAGVAGIVSYTLRSPKVRMAGTSPAMINRCFNSIHDNKRL